MSAMRRTFVGGQASDRGIVNPVGCRMWYDDLIYKKSWSTLWSGLIVCGKCLGIRGTEGECPVCGVGLPEQELMLHRVDGDDVVVSTICYMGAEGRFEDYVYLKMLEREWKRPLTEADELAAKDPRQKLSPKSAIVVLFWSYFETRIARLLRDSMRDVPGKYVDYMLGRNSGIESRLREFYKFMFETTYWADLTALGFDRVKEHLLKVQKHRNDFAHGDPNAIDDALVKAVVDNLKDEHESWIAVYNKRAARQL